MLGEKKKLQFSATSFHNAVLVWDWVRAGQGAEAVVIHTPSVLCSKQTKRHQPAMRKACSSCPVLFPFSISHTFSSFKGSSPCIRRTQHYFGGQPAGRLCN